MAIPELTVPSKQADSPLASDLDSYMTEIMAPDPESQTCRRSVAHDSQQQRHQKTPVRWVPRDLETFSLGTNRNHVFYL